MPDRLVASVGGDIMRRPGAPHEARPPTAAPRAYAISVVAVLAAGVLNWLLWDWIRPQAGALLLTAVVVSAWYGGLGPGILASLLATLARAVFYAEPLLSPLIE